MFRCSKTLVVLAAAALLGLGTQAQAGLIPTNVSVTPDGSNFRWTYAVVVTTDVHVHSGDFFTIYDFGGMVTGPGGSLSNVLIPAGWSVSSAMVGATPTGTAPTDDPHIPNLTFTYNGPDIVGQTGLGNFMAISTFGDATTSAFTSITHRNVDGRSEANITSTDVPVPSNVAGTPEPATLGMFGLGLPVLGLGRWLRRRLRKA
jgi:hypothetical protein